jgi:hypothetical protein
MSNCEEVIIPTLVPDRVQQCQLGSSMINLFSDYIHRLGRQFAIIIISTLQYSGCWINKTEPHLITFVPLLGSNLHLTINNEMFPALYSHRRILWQSTGGILSPGKCGRFPPHVRAPYLATHPLRRESAQTRLERTPDSR